MALTLEEVDHIAQLARLHLTEAEKTRYREQLSAVLEYAAKLQTLDTSEIAPTASVQSEGSRLREDELRPGLQLEDLQRNAPDMVNGQFRVPPVLDME
jgi:aspartyl-tRNA(Asn)/glutamyl-tRNA(Gln) amidotransferase subunit C